MLCKSDTIYLLGVIISNYPGVSGIGSLQIKQDCYLYTNLPSISLLRS